MFSHLGKRMLSGSLAMVLMGGLCVGPLSVSANAVSSDSSESLQSVTDSNGTTTAYEGTALKSTEYAEYLAKYADTDRPTTRIEIGLGQLCEGQNLTTIETQEQGTVLELLEDDLNVAFRFEVPTSGLYDLQVLYCQAGEQMVSPISLDVLIDGVVPSYAMNAMTLPRYWRIAEKKYDSRGNEMSNELEQAPRWESYTLQESSGQYNGALGFYLEAGEHTVSFHFEKSGLLLKSACFFNEDVAPAYVKPNAEAAKDSGDVAEGEEYVWISDSSILLGTENNNPSMSPCDPEIRYYNFVGGNSYATTRQRIAWQVEVKESGYYKIAFKVRQSIKNGSFSTRCLRIGGKVPYAECTDLRFPYSNKWYNMVPGDVNGEPMLFYLEAGTHEVSLEVVPGSMSDAMVVLQDCVDRLNTVLRKVITVVGTEGGDKYRDYYLSEDIPELGDEIASLLSVMKGQYNNILQLGGEKGSELSTLQTMITQLEVFSEDLDAIAMAMSSFKANISGLAAWVNELTTQPLEIDYIVVYGDDDELPPAAAGFFQKIWFTIRRLFLSFQADYGMVGDWDESEEYLTVWTSVGQEQLSIIQNLADTYSAMPGKVGVKVELVTVPLVEAVMAGEGPDISIGLGTDVPVNLAARGELVDLSQFAGFESAKERYRHDAFASYQYNGGVYAMPLTEVFPMLFVRTDIFEELGLQVPQTWDEIYEIATILHRKNLDVGISSDMTTFASMVMQKGGTFYNEHLDATSFDQAPETDAFKEWTSLYTDKGFDLAYDFMNRFRTGEMPIGITQYNMYTMLSVSAPEIDDRWEMYPMVGTKKENGEIDRSCCNVALGSYGIAQGGSCAFILGDCKNKEAAWDFLSWYTSDEVQTEYALKIEMRMGISSRQTPANYKVLDNLPWTAEEKAKLYAQWDELVILPEVPGSYYVGRNLTYAFRKVVYDAENPVYALNKYNEIINREFKRKLSELQK